MGIPYNKYIQLLRESKKKRRQLACLVTALSVFVSGGVFWQLRGIGTAMVNENLPTADDSGCDLTATPLGASELETRDVWEATLPTLTDIAGENLARIAESQLGYSESSINFVHAEDGETHNGYTRYGAWYGNPYGDWNTMFTYFCMNYAGIGSDDIPYGSGCWAWSLELDKGGLVVPATRGSPARGDILLIDSDLDGKADRSCIVTAVSDDDIPEISAIEGDVDGEVAATAYLLDDEHLLGMVSLADIVPEPPVLPEEPAYVDFTAESESGIRVEAHADSFAFPSDTEMFVFDISRDDAIQTAAAHFGDADSDTIEAVAVDITFMTPDGSELEPAEGSLVSVNISLPEEHSLTGGEFSLLHVSDDGGVQEVADASVSADGAEFVAEEFSVYVMTSNGFKPLDSLTMVNGNVGNNSEQTPYVVYVGDTIDIFMSGSSQFYVQNNQSANDSNKNKLLRTVGNYATTIEYNSETISGIRGAFRAELPEPVCVSNENDSIYFQIKEPTIYVKSEYTDKPKDRIKEWLSGFGLPNVDGYVPNSESYPYRIRVGDSFNIYADGNSIFSLTDSSILKREADDGKYSVFTGLTPGKTSIELKSGDNVIDRLWVEVWEDTSEEGSYFHADMEIADGGKYTVSSVEYDAYGNKITTVNIYEAYVKDVNESRLYDSSDNVVMTYVPTDYTTQGEPGETQYEITSAWNCVWVSAKHFDPTQVEYAVFDVNLILRPYQTYTIDDNGVKSTTQPLSGDDAIIEKVIFNLGNQPILDAINKCPNSNGFDFTVKANAAIAKIQAKKDLEGRTLNADEFTFELWNSTKTEKILTASNDIDGNVSLENQVYTKTGEYRYILKENAVSDDNTTIYDNAEFEIVVTVSEDSSGMMVASIAYPNNKIPKFTNYQTYTLPSTGGTGELPYIFFGGTMLAGAFTLLFIRRKKAAAR